MTSHTIGINGFGRIGRLVVHLSLKNGNLHRIVGINDPFMSAEQMAYLLKYDSVHGGLKNSVIEASDNFLVINGHKIQTFFSKAPNDIPWGELNCNYIIECTGVFNTSAKAQAHLEAGARKVIISGIDSYF